MFFDSFYKQVTNLIHYVGIHPRNIYLDCLFKNIATYTHIRMSVLLIIKRVRELKIKSKIRPLLCQIIAILWFVQYFLLLKLSQYIIIVRPRERCDDFQQISKIPNTKRAGDLKRSFGTCRIWRFALCLRTLLNHTKLLY